MKGNEQLHLTSFLIPRTTCSMVGAINTVCAGAGTPAKRDRSFFKIYNHTCKSEPYTLIVKLYIRNGFI